MTFLHGQALRVASLPSGSGEMGISHQLTRILHLCAVARAQPSMLL